MSTPASLSISAAAGNRSASCPLTLSNCAWTAAASGWAKIERTSVATNGPADLGTRVSRFRRKFVRHRCQDAPGRAEAIASTRPGWALEITQANPGEPAGHETSQERGPSGPVLGGVQVKAQDLPGARGVHAGGDHDRQVGDPAAFSDLLGVRSGRSVVRPSQAVRLSGPRLRTDVRVSTHPALHESTSRDDRRPSTVHHPGRRDACRPVPAAGHRDRSGVEQHDVVLLGPPLREVALRYLHDALRCLWRSQHTTRRHVNASR